MDLDKFSSDHIKNKMVTLTSETIYSEYCFETKLQAKFDESDWLFDQPK